MFNFQEFHAKNPDIAYDNEDMIIDIILGDDEYVCEVSVDGNLVFTQNFKFKGIAELRKFTKKFKFDRSDDMKLIVETSPAEVNLSTVMIRHIPFRIPPILDLPGHWNQIFL